MKRLKTENDKFYVDRCNRATTYIVCNKCCQPINNREEINYRTSTYCMSKGTIIASIDNKHRLHLYKYWDDYYLHKKHITWFTGHTINEIKEFINSDNSSVIVEHKIVVVNKYGILSERSSI